MPKPNAGAPVSHDRAPLNETNDTQSMPQPPRARKLDLAIAPQMVSQRTSLQVLGIPGSSWPDWVRSLGIPHRRVGQLTLVRVEDALRVLGPEQSTPTPTTETAVDPAAAVRDALGLQRRGQR